MSRPLVIEFTKMHGAGNDFIMIDNRFLYLSQQELSELALRYCPRHYSLGADGLIALSNATSEDSDFAMEYYNADGSRGEMCGNGARCLARFAFDSGIQKESLVFDSDIGEMKADIVQMDPSLVRVQIPEREHQVKEIELNTAYQHFFSSSYFFNSGVPHVIVFVDDLDQIPVQEIGSIIRNDQQFENGANVNFVQKTEANNRFKVRTYERGVEAETKACGTGAIAVAEVAQSFSESDLEDITIEMPGGDLVVAIPVTTPEHKKGPVNLTGPTFKVCRGSIEL